MEKELAMPTTEQIRNRLTIAMWLGAEYRSKLTKDIGLLFNEGSRIVVDDVDKQESWTWAGKAEHIPVGQIIKVGVPNDDQFPLNSPENLSYMEVLGKDAQDVIHLKTIVFFKTKLTNGRCQDEVYVAASDRSDAVKLLRQYAIKNGYVKMVSITPFRNEPLPHDVLVTETKLNQKN
jgi:hypothetical protein